MNKDIDVKVPAKFERVIHKQKTQYQVVAISRVIDIVRHTSNVDRRGLFDEVDRSHGASDDWERLTPRVPNDSGRYSSGSRPIFASCRIRKICGSKAKKARGENLQGQLLTLADLFG